VTLIRVPAYRCEEPSEGGETYREANSFGKVIYLQVFEIESVPRYRGC